MCKNYLRPLREGRWERALAVAVHCIRCGAYGASAKTVEWAVALWNQRPGEPLEL